VKKVKEGSGVRDVPLLAIREPVACPRTAAPFFRSTKWTPPFLWSRLRVKGRVSFLRRISAARRVVDVREGVEGLGMGAVGEEGGVPSAGGDVLAVIDPSSLAVGGTLFFRPVPVEKGLPHKSRLCFSLSLSTPPARPPSWAAFSTRQRGVLTNFHFLGILIKLFQSANLRFKGGFGTDKVAETSLSILRWTILSIRRVAYESV
jgi:hypothetical protein